MTRSNTLIVQDGEYNEAASRRFTTRVFPSPLYPEDPQALGSIHVAADSRLLARSILLSTTSEASDIPAGSGHPRDEKGS